ncbi:MAG TPA: MauE/DoxX family redox-associated membrane protein [Actinomycetes bacterium]|nr:MauE/DoxX family redox-associated membrane protein [Actinomycetes bacterium]
MEIVALIARVALAATFIVSAIAKVRDADGARQAVRDFGVPASVVPLVATSLAPLELASAVLLLTTDIGVTVGAALAAVLLAAFTAGIVVNLLRGKRVDCHCFGAMSTKPLSWWSVARNGVLLALAAITLAGGTSQGWPWQVVEDAFDDLTTTETWLSIGLIVLGIAVVVLTYLFLAVLRRHGHALLRIEELEAGGAHVHGHAHDFAPWDAPQLTASDEDGGELSLDDVAASDRPNVFVFVAPWCEACGELVDDLLDWQADETGPNVVVLSAGERDAITEKFGDVQVLAHDGTAVDDYRVEYTPGALVVSTDLMITAPPSYGSEDVRRLYNAVAGRQTQDLVIGPPPVREGDPVPDVIVELDGERLPIAQAAGDDAVLLFWDTTCGFCQQIQDDVIRRQDSVPLVLVLRSDSADSVRAAGFTVPVALDPMFGVGGALQVPGTPTAVRLRDGAVASTVAVGGPEVLGLLASVRVMG